MSLPEQHDRQQPNSMSLQSLLGSIRSALADHQSAQSRLQLTLTQTPPQAGALATEEVQRGVAVAAVEEGQFGGAAPPPTVPLLATAGGGSGPLPGLAPPAAGGSGGLGAADVGPGDIAAAAEHHRLTNLSSSIDLRAVAVALERGLPYATLLLFLFISAHIVGLGVFAYLSFVLHRLNQVIRSQVALKQDRRVQPLLAAAGVVVVQVPLALVALWRQDVLGNMVLAGTQRPSQFWDVIFAVVVGDTLLRFLTVLLKVLVLLLVPVDSTAKFRRRGHILTAVEYCASLYRMLPPAPLWYHFFTQASVSSLLQTGLSGAYLLVKAQHVFERAQLAAVAVRQVAVRGYGSTPSADEVQEAGNSCPICQDSYRDPVKLSCGHIFCTDCCGEWFERERTCPMCRANVGPANKRFRSFADGNTPVLPIIF